MDFSNIKVFAIDLDGTLTNGMYWVDDNGKVTKQYNTRDSWAINCLKRHGYAVYIITTSTDGSGPAKAATLNVPIFTGIRNKAELIEKSILRPGILEWENIAYMGDAENDKLSLEKAGFSALPADHVFFGEDKIDVNYTSKAKGGEGAVYEMVKWFLMMQDKTIVPKDHYTAAS